MIELRELILIITYLVWPNVDPDHSIALFVVSGAAFDFKLLDDLCFYFLCGWGLILKTGLLRFRCVHSLLPPRRFQLRLLQTLAFSIGLVDDREAWVQECLQRRPDLGLCSIESHLLLFLAGQHFLLFLFFMFCVSPRARPVFEIAEGLQHVAHFVAPWPVTWVPLVALTRGPG